MLTRMMSITNRRFFPIIVFAAVAVIALLADVFFQESICVFLRLSGIPCPACGMTRAAIALFNFDISSALMYHPLVLMPAAICIPALFGKLTERICIILVALLLLIWIIRMFTMFPNQAPMIFYERGLIPVIFNRIFN